MKTIALVGCGKSKVDFACAAKDLYTGPLFRKCRRYAELVADEWYILSAEHGLVFPDQVLAPYDRELPEIPKQYDWATMVMGQMYWRTSLRRYAIQYLREGDYQHNTVRIIFLASKKYRNRLVYLLGLNKAHQVEIPMESLPIGKQLAWLNQAINNLKGEANATE